MELVLGTMAPAGNLLPVEVVERKGLGHPDSISDALAETVSLRLSRYYLERFGLVLHHNVDKVLLVGGSSQAAFGGGHMIAPIEVFVAGRATRELRGEQIPVDDLAVAACREWLREHLPQVDPDRNVRLHTRIRSGSSELVELFLRSRSAGQWLANDTSIGVGFAPLSDLEDTVLEIERRLNDPTTKRAHPEIGTDVKVLGVRHGQHVTLTVAAAMVDRYVASLDDYSGAVQAAAEVTREACVLSTEGGVDVAVNAGDDIAAGQIYLTVTGTSAEAGDDGEAGRGNRANGLITPFRVMTMESVAGKNPVTHVGKLYNLAAALLAEEITQGVPGVTAANCLMVSRIGTPVTDPAIVEVRLTTDGRSLAELELAVSALVHSSTQRIPRLVDDLLTGALAFDRWPLRTADRGDTDAKR